MIKLDLDRNKIDKARSCAKSIASKVQEMIIRHSTHSVERAVLRLMGLDGVDDKGVPLPNILVGHLSDRLDNGIALLAASAMIQKGLTIEELAQKVSEGSLDLRNEKINDPEVASKLAVDLARKGFELIEQQRNNRENAIVKLGQSPQPWLYVIVATGNIYADVIQADMVVRQGADVVAVIRSTGQSLLDFVPHGPTTEGFGGTFATRANFAIMREALDKAGEREGRYIRQVNYASGLCMPEIAVLGAMERLDMMLNDCLYGILFRDINPIRTFVDQHFSRMINAFAGIIINTGEDNYLTTADAVEKGHTVLASDFINEAFAGLSGLSPWQMGLGHAFEINPDISDSLSLEIAMAALVRKCFPDAPIKYMPPTKHMTGDIFFGYVLNTMFNLVGTLTDQGIQLLGMLTEASHTPFVSDRYLSLKNARYVFNAARSLGSQIQFDSEGLVSRRATEVLNEAVEELSQIEKEGLLAAIARGAFADIKRSTAGGKGANGVILKGPNYFNPAYPILAERIDAAITEVNKS